MSTLGWAFVAGLLVGAGATLLIGWVIELVVDYALSFFTHRGGREDV